jgi:hypothetical protein
MIENMKLALRENLWQGRSGGFDINTSQSLLNDLSSPILKSSPSQLSSSQDGLGIAVTRPSGSSSHKTKKNRKLSVPLSTSESVNADVNLENSFKQVYIQSYFIYNILIKLNRLSRLLLKQIPITIIFLLWVQIKYHQFH